MLKYFKVFVIFIFLFLFNFCSPKAEIVDGIIAIVNNEVITQGELNEVLLPVYAQYKAVYSDEELLRKLGEARKNILQQLINDKLIVQEARRQEILVADEETEERLEQIKSQFSDENEFKEALESQGLTVNDLKEKYEEQILIKKFVSGRVQSSIKVTPLEVTRYYEEHKEEFKVAPQVQAQMILIRKSEDNPEVNPSARAAAKKVHKSLEEGADFSKLAREYSHDPSASNGGDMGYIKKGQMMEEIDSALFSSKKDEISDIIESAIGYHIFKVTKIEEPRLKTFEEARLNIEGVLYQEKAKLRFGELIDGLKKNAYISIK